MAGKAFIKISETFDSIELKELVSGLLRISIENNSVKETFLARKESETGTDDNIIEVFQQMTERKENKRKPESKSFIKEKKILTMKIDLDYIFKAGNKNFVQVVDNLLQNNVSVNAFDDSLQETMLMYAARNKFLALAQYLIRNGADTELLNVKFR